MIVYSTKGDTMLNKGIIGVKLEEFIKKYGSIYDEDMLDYIKENFFTMYGSKETTDVLRQIYSDLDMYEEDENLYIEHLNKIKSNFNIESDVLEVAGGCIPSFANILAKEQIKLGKGTITVYDPSLVKTESKYSNLKLYKNSFYLDTDVSKFNLIVGLYPCNATLNIIESACVNKKDFYVAMCGCVHFDFIRSMQYGMSPAIYQDYIISNAKRLLEENNNGTLVIDEINEKYGESEYPVLYNKRS